MRFGLVVICAWLSFAATAAAEQWNAFSSCDTADAEIRARELYDLRGFCNPTILVRRHRAFRVSTLAAAARDARAVRVMVAEGRRYGDGVSHNVVLVDVLEHQNVVRATVRVIARDGERPRLRAEFSHAAWEELSEQAAALEIAPGVAPDRGDLWLHPMEVIVETNGFGPERVLYADISTRSATFEFAMRVVELTAAALPQCERLHLEETGPWRLRDCVRQLTR